MYSKVRSEEKCFGEFARYTSLNVLGMIGLSCYILADTFFVSKGLGTNGLVIIIFNILMLRLEGNTGVAAVFNSEKDRRLQMIAVEGIRLYFTALPFAGFNIVISTYFTSTERAVPAHIVSLLRGIVLIVPMAFFMAYVWKITGVWLAFSMTDAMVCLIGMGIFRAKR